VSSIFCCKGYIVEIGFDVPVWIEGIAEPIFTNAVSSRSAFAKVLPLPLDGFDGSDDYEAQRAAAVKICAPTKTHRRRRTFSASYMQAACGTTARPNSGTTAARGSRSTKPQPFAIRPGVPACINGHALMASHNAKSACSICGCGCSTIKTCADISCRSSSTICDGCLDFLAPNTQAAFFVVAAAELVDADFNHDDAIQALGQISTASGNIVPLDGRQIAGLKLHRAADDDEIEGNHAPITTQTRDILLKALLHTHNTVESNIELQLKADTLAAGVATSDAAIAVLRNKLHRMESEAADLKRIHATTAHMVACNKLRGFGELPQSPVVSGKERALMVRKRCTFAAVSAVAADVEMADAADAAASDSDSDSSDSSDSDSDDIMQQSSAPKYVFTNDSDDEA
jgi:hypothetical protein